MSRRSEPRKTSGLITPATVAIPFAIYSAPVSLSENKGTKYRPHSSDDAQLAPVQCRVCRGGYCCVLLGARRVDHFVGARLGSLRVD
jgi:hypothetical protein